jgi:hypothetical protein
MPKRRRSSAGGSYPTDSSLLGDGVRVLTRVMKKVTEVASQVGTPMRDRMRSVKHRILEIARASRDRGEKGQEKRRAAYSKLLDVTSRVVGQAKKFSAEIANKVKRGPRQILQKARRLGLPGFPLRMISVVCSNRLTILPAELVMPWKMRARVWRTTCCTRGSILSNRTLSVG